VSDASFYGSCGRGSGSNPPGACGVRGGTYYASVVVDVWSSRHYTKCSLGAQLLSYPLVGWWPPRWELPRAGARPRALLRCGRPRVWPLDCRASASASLVADADAAGACTGVTTLDGGPAAFAARTAARCTFAASADATRTPRSALRSSLRQSSALLRMGRTTSPMAVSAPYAQRTHSLARGRLSLFGSTMASNNLPTATGSAYTSSGNISTGVAVPGSAGAVSVPARRLTLCRGTEASGFTTLAGNGCARSVRYVSHHNGQSLKISAIVT